MRQLRITLTDVADGQPGGPWFPVPFPSIGDPAAKAVSRKATLAMVGARHAGRSFRARLAVPRGGLETRFNSILPQ